MNINFEYQIAEFYTFENMTPLKQLRNAQKWSTLYKRYPFRFVQSGANKVYIRCGYVVQNVVIHNQGRRSGYESGGDGIHVNPERSFGGTNGEPPSEASERRKGGPGVLPRKI